ncbi:MAG: anti-sigma factor antagonist [Solirubrobacteraceae bacterium]|nr:anti-sigma factor antagonist [Solirubrobacteraceae bacterium]
MIGPAHRTDHKVFRCDVACDDDVERIVLEGELDLATVAAVQAALREPLDPGIERRVLDLRGLTFMDSTGLRTILSANRAARREGWSLQIVAGPPAVQRIFEICGVADVLRFVDP